MAYKQGEKDCDEIYQQYHNSIEEDGPSTGSRTLTVYPNPANDVLVVETQDFASQPTTIAYRITNLMGQTVLSGYITTENQRINISNMSEGIYFITVDGQTVKFVVK